MATTAEHSTTEHLTFHFEESDGWVTARIEEEPAAISQGRSREEARDNVLDALHELRCRPPRLTERVARAVQARFVEPLSAILEHGRQRQQH